jgi:hypothetical protein
VDSIAAAILFAGQGLSRVFRGKFVAGLKRAFRRKELAFFGACLPLAQEKAF